MSEPLEPASVAEPDAVETTPPARRRPTARELAALAGRTTAGMVIVAVAAVVAGGSAFLRFEPVVAGEAPAAATVTPAAAPQRLGCPGGLLRLGDESGASADRISPVGLPDLAWTGDDIDARDVTTTNAGTDGTAAIGRLATAGAVGVDGGFQTEAVAGTVRGLATAACTVAESDQWLVAGATTLGRTALLILENPSPVEAEVTLEVYGEQGGVTAGGLDGIRLAPDEQRVIALNGLVVGLASPVVHVVSTGGKVVAHLESTITRTLTPGGVDLAGSQQPATTLAIPGVRVAARGELAPLDVSEADHADVSPVLRLLAPQGGGDAVATTIAWIPAGATLADALAAHQELDANAGGSEDQGSVVGDDAAAAGADAAPLSVDVTLTPGVVTEVPVPGIAAGDYTVVITAATPLVGAVRTSVIAGGAVDFAWSEPAAALGDDVAIAVPATAGVAATLWLANPGEADAAVEVGADGAAGAAVTVPAGAAVPIALPSGTVVRLHGATGLVGAVLSGGPGLLAQSPLPGATGAAGAVHVRL